jgi:hypothetical protein
MSYAVLHKWFSQRYFFVVRFFAVRAKKRTTLGKYHAAAGKAAL